MNPVKSQPPTQPPSDFLLRCWPFLTLFSACLLLGLGAQSYYDKTQLHLLLITQEPNALTYFFTILTYLGDWQIALLIGLIIAYRHNQPHPYQTTQNPYKRHTLSHLNGLIFYLIACLLQFLLTHGIKHLFFSQKLRPIHYYQQLNISIQNIPNLIDQGRYFHFPSGHTSMAFTAFLALATLNPNRYFQILCALLAISVAYSRLYLAQHYVLDTLAGSFIGVICVIISYYLCQTPLNKHQPSQK